MMNGDEGGQLSDLIGGDTVLMRGDIRLIGGDPPQSPPTRENPGLRTYFILKRDRFLTTAIFTGSASTVHNSLKIMFQNFIFWCYLGNDTCLSVLRVPFLE